MNVTYQLLFLTSCVLSGSVIISKAEPIICKNHKKCLDMHNSCQCYCSRMCGPRDKESDDSPVYDANDPAGKYCYCKKWDKDNYTKRKCHLKAQK